MIKLQPAQKPIRLTDELVSQLTKKYKDTKKPVWQKSYIRKSLLKMSFDKCCFCETKLGEESKYLEIDHFHPKSLYEDEVILLENLLPVCKRCNGSKLKHDTKKEKIIHPIRDNPKEHLELLEGGILRGTTELGKSTTKVIKLNDKKQKLDVIRDDISKATHSKLIDLLDFTKIYFNNPSDYWRDKIIRNLTTVMTEGTKEYDYSATAATVILTDSNYQEIKQLFESNNLWNDVFKELEQQVEFCALI